MKGYYGSGFHDARQRYCPPPLNVRYLRLLHCRAAQRRFPGSGRPLRIHYCHASSATGPAATNPGPAAAPSAAAAASPLRYLDHALLPSSSGGSRSSRPDRQEGGHCPRNPPTTKSGGWTPGIDRIVGDHGVGIPDTELATCCHEQSVHCVSQPLLRRTATVVVAEFVRTALVHGAHPPGVVLHLPGSLLELSRAQDAQLLHHGAEPSVLTVDPVALVLRVRDSVKAADQMNELPRRGGTLLAQVVERRVPTDRQSVPFLSPLHQICGDETCAGTDYHQQYARCCRGSIHAGHPTGCEAYSHQHGVSVQAQP